MRAAVYYNNKDVRLEERPVPKISDGELLKGRGTLPTFLTGDNIIVFPFNA